MCIAGDGTQLFSIEEKEFLTDAEQLTTDGRWYAQDSNIISCSLDETKRYGDDKLMQDHGTWGLLLI